MLGVTFDTSSVSVGELCVSIEAKDLVHKNAGSFEEDQILSAAKIQSLYKGKQVRKVQAIQWRSACKIQAIWKGRQQRKRFKVKEKEAKKLAEEEEVKRKRRVRMMAAQRELQLLLNLKGNQLAQYLDFKRNKAARIIQKLCRRYILRHKTTMLSRARKNIMNVHGSKG